MKQLFIVVNNPSLQNHQENSAVYNYLLFLQRILLGNGVNAAIYPKPLQPPFDQPLKGVQKPNYLKQQLSKYPYIFNSLKGFVLFRAKQRFAMDFEANTPNESMVWEFYTYGSNLMKAIPTRSVTYNMVYDAPIEEQFRDMHGAGSFLSNRALAYEHRAVRAARRILCYSNAVKDYLVEMHNVSAQKIEVFPCFIQPNKPIQLDSLSNSETTYIGFIGSFLSWHKVDLLVQAFEKAISSLPAAAKLVLIGKGQEWENVKKQVDNSPAKDRIEMTGYVTDAELMEWKKKIKIGVMPGSNWYGSPLKLFEYMYAGIPFIAPKTPTIEYIFRTNTDCLTIDTHDELHSLVNHLVKLYSSEKLQLELNKNALERVQTTFSTDKLVALLKGETIGYEG